MNNGGFIAVKKNPTMRIFFQVVKLYFDCFYNWEQKKDLSLLLRVHQ